jgi:hypothetical protein
VGPSEGQTPSPVRDNSSTAAEARARPVPLWRWALWWVLLLIAGVLFYFVMAPIWLGLRAAAWIAEFKARRRRS